MKKTIRNTLYMILSALNLILPKKEKKIFIYDYKNMKSNCWAIFKYLADKGYNSEYTITYFCKNDKVKSEYSSLRNIKVTSNSVSGLIDQMTSRYVFYEYGFYRFSMRPSKKQTVFNVWHGMPLKRIGYMAQEKPIHPYEQDFDYILATSEFYKKIIMSCFGCEDKKVYIGGYPRCDAMSRCENDVYAKLGNHGSLKILWMPTFRNSDTNKMYDSNIEFPILSESNISAFNDFLKRNNITLFIKLHPFQREIQIFKVTYTNIIVVENQDLDNKNILLYELVGQSDCLITDYSSVYLEYLMTHKVIIFATDDFEDYKSKRGFIVSDITTMMPGPITTNIKEFTTAISDLLTGKDAYKEKREALNMLVNQYETDHTEKLLRFCGITKEDSSIRSRK